MPEPAAIGVDGVRLGHWTDAEAETGCTVLTLPDRVVASGEIRGGAPASRELDALAADKSVQEIHAVVLTGGSAFGLAAADGVMRRLEEQGRGVETPGGRVPLVPTLALFDLAVGDPAARPGPEQGYEAAVAAEGEQVLSGRVGAGTGAYVSHWRGADGRRHGGLGYAEHRFGDLVVAALCAVNAFGDVDDGSGPVPVEALAAISEPFGFGGGDRAHTTIGVVLTNARLDKVGCLIAAQGAHDGLGRALNPPHTRFDGDGFVAVATGRVDAHVDAVRALALASTAAAIRSVA